MPPLADLLITTIQTDLVWEEKEKNLDLLERKIVSIDGKAEVVVLPEMFSTGFSMNPKKLAEDMAGPSLQWMKRVAAEKRVILTGSLIIEEEGKYYNRLIWMLPNGSYGTYNKRHLFAYADEHKHYTPGTNRFIASVKGWKINLQICYDLRFPIWARQSKATNFAVSAELQEDDENPEYDVLVYAANWPEKRNHAWKTLLQARAIENQAFVVGVNRVGADGNETYYSGDSMIIDPLGEILYTHAHHEHIQTTLLSHQKLTEVRDRLPFLKDADHFFIEI